MPPAERPLAEGTAAIGANEVAEDGLGGGLVLEVDLGDDESEGGVNEPLDAGPAAEDDRSRVNGAEGGGVFQRLHRIQNQIHEHLVQQIGVADNQQRAWVCPSQSDSVSAQLAVEKLGDAIEH